MPTKYKSVDSPAESDDNAVGEDVFADIVGLEDFINDLANDPFTAPPVKNFDKASHTRRRTPTKDSKTKLLPAHAAEVAAPSEHLEFLGDRMINAGPDGRELSLRNAELAYKSGNDSECAFYQVSALYQSNFAHFLQCISQKSDDAPFCGAVSEMSPEEKAFMKSNYLFAKILQKAEDEETLVRQEVNASRQHNFLQGVTKPAEGAKRIEDVCAQLPKEWTILMLCKGLNPLNTYVTFPLQIKGESSIYLTLLRHQRSAEYPQPICLEIGVSTEFNLFEAMDDMRHRFMRDMNVNPNDYVTSESKVKYWANIAELHKRMSHTLMAFKRYVSPWNFLFNGQLKPNQFSQKCQRKVFGRVDKICDRLKCNPRQRVLLSLAAVRAETLSEKEICDICERLWPAKKSQKTIIEFLCNERVRYLQDTDTSPDLLHYPCILITDERLDHFFWEELNVKQEFTRINSLQGLFLLFNEYKSSIRNGYMLVNVSQGACLVNADGSLPKTEQRMKSFFQYWLPHWMQTYRVVPNHEQLEKFCSQPCYVYSGHSSGLQFLNGKKIAKMKISAVVFLFGCDSTRYRSKGLYSELTAAHLYYQVAKCPAVVGTLLPCLDGWMDSLSANILSRWVVPTTDEVMPWSCINQWHWIKTGEMKPSEEHIKESGQAVSNMSASPGFHIGSLCGIVSQVHQLKYNTKLYHTVPYVCRGLPVWNTAAEKFA